MDKIENFKSDRDATKILESIVIYLNGWFFVIIILLLCKIWGVELTSGFLSTVLPMWLLLVIKIISIYISLFTIFFAFEYGKRVMILVLGNLDDKKTIN